MKAQAVETILALDQLRKSLTAEGSLCTYQELTRAIGKDSQGDGYCSVKSARNAFEREKQCRLGIDPGNGIRWLTPRENINATSRKLLSLHRQSRRELGRQSILLPSESKLPSEDRALLFAQTSHLSVLMQLSKPSCTKKLGEAMQSAPRLLNSADTLALFQNGKANKKAE